MLRLRILSAIVLGSAVVAVVFLGQPWLTLSIGLICAVAAWETFTLLRAAGFAVQPWLGVAGAVLAVADAAFGPRQSGLSAAYVAVVVIGFALAALRHPEPRLGFAAWMSGAFGVLYVGLLAYTVRILEAAPAIPSGASFSGVLDAGRVWLLVLVFGVWTFDTFAFLAGRAIGRGRFMNHISPSKTWSGVVGGTAAAMIVTGALATAAGRDTIGGAVLGLAISAAAQAGDLAESLLKRTAGAKDSGRLIPGHGGILDRVDSILFAAPAVYAYLAVTSVA